MHQFTTRLKPGQLLREEIARVAAEHDISAGVVVSLVGGLERARLRMTGAAPEKQDVRDLRAYLRLLPARTQCRKAACISTLRFQIKMATLLAGICEAD